MRKTLTAIITALSIATTQAQAGILPAHAIPLGRVNSIPLEGTGLRKQIFLSINGKQVEINSFYNVQGWPNGFYLAASEKGEPLTKETREYLIQAYDRDGNGSIDLVALDKIGHPRESIIFLKNLETGDYERLFCFVALDGTFISKYLPLIDGEQRNLYDQVFYKVDSLAEKVDARNSPQKILSNSYVGTLDLFVDFKEKISLMEGNE
jgi:hypothetical protein